MPSDIAYPYSYTAGGDIQTVEEADFYEQHAFILAAEAIDSVVGESLTANETVEITSTIEDAFAGSPYFSSPVSVTITNVSDTELSLDARVGVDETISVAVPLSEVSDT